MKNFKTPLLIEGTPLQLDSLIPKLENLGYTCLAMDKNDFCGLITFFNGTKYNITNITGSIDSYLKVSFSNKRRLKVNASNPELVLALAAMVDDDELHAGEWLYCHSDSVSSANNKPDFYSGRLYKCVIDYDPRAVRHCFRKATVEEIFQHFNMKTTGNMVCSSDGVSERKIIGYKVKDGIDKTAARLLVGLMEPPIKVNDNPEIVFERNSDVYNVAIKLGILEQLFEPAYEEPVFKVGDYIYTSPGSNGHGLHPDDINKVFKVKEISRGNYLSLDTISGQNKYTHGVRAQDVRKATPEEIATAQTKIITLRCKGGTFDIEVSKKGIYYRPKTSAITNDYNTPSYVFTPSHIPIEDWVKVLDAYYEIKNDKA